MTLPVDDDHQRARHMTVDELCDRLAVNTAPQSFKLAALDELAVRLKDKIDALTVIAAGKGAEAELANEALNDIYTRLQLPNPPSSSGPPK